MTKEEAITILTETQVVYFAPNGKEKAQEALDMAIETLQAVAEQEAVPTVVRVTMSDGSQYYLEHERDVIQADAVQSDAISKRFVSDAIVERISGLNAQGEKAIPIAREFIRFKKFVDGITPTRTEAVQGEWKIDEYGIYHCPYCHAINNTVYKSYCPNCGARMYKGGDSE